jgi:hypothetical protein
MDESGGVVQVERTRGRHTFGAENRHGQLVAESAVGAIWEKV